MTAGNRVLVVDDDPAYVRATELLLSAHGYEVNSASCGDEALDKMREQRPDVVVLDIMMDWPLEGLHVTREMLRQRQLQGLPIIIVSSIMDSEYRTMFPEDEYLHLDAWLHKPCPPAELVAKVGEVLSRYERYKAAS